MKIKISKSWCIRMAHHEGDAEIGAGKLAFDPTFDSAPVSTLVSNQEIPNIALGRFINLMRRQRGMSLEQLASAADVDILDLFEIEKDPHHRPELRTTYQLANYFEVSRTGLMQLAGLAEPKDTSLFDEGVRFAARSEPTAELTAEERVALETFVATLSKHK